MLALFWWSGTNLRIAEVRILETLKSAYRFPLMEKLTIFHFTSLSQNTHFWKRKKMCRENRSVWRHSWRWLSDDWLTVLEARLWFALSSMTLSTVLTQSPALLHMGPFFFTTVVAMVHCNCTYTQPQVSCQLSIVGVTLDPFPLILAMRITSTSNISGCASQTACL